MTEQERELKELRRKVVELTYLRQLDMAEIVRLRRMIEAEQEKSEDRKEYVPCQQMLKP